jgi:hypothetical protein
MAFLDNSGDIILDAVLTDTGRKRLARGDGSFKIVKFSLGDDEIDYSLYRNSNSIEGVHPSGSAYYDLNILQLPILEAFTNNTSILKSKLVSYVQNDLLYLPVVLLNNIMFPTATSVGYPRGGYLMTADNTTSALFTEDAYVAGTAAGFIKGDSITTQDAFRSRPVIFDQGLDTTELSVGFLADGDARKETAFIVELDNRLFDLYPPLGENLQAAKALPSYIDDDNVASYFFARNTTGPNTRYFAARDSVGTTMNGFSIINGNGDTNSVLGKTVAGDSSGRYGTRFGFRLGASLNTQTSAYLFNLLGSTESRAYAGAGAASKNYKFINTVIRVTGYTTGYRVDIPIKLIKTYT